MGCARGILRRTAVVDLIVVRVIVVRGPSSGPRARRQADWDVDPVRGRPDWPWPVNARVFHNVADRYKECKKKKKWKSTPAQHDQACMEPDVNEDT
jgi:hypothetical protein